MVYQVERGPSVSWNPMPKHPILEEPFTLANLTLNSGFYWNGKRALLQKIWACGAEETGVCGCRNKALLLIRVIQITSVVSRKEHTCRPTHCCIPKLEGVGEITQWNICWGSMYWCGCLLAHRHLQDLLTIISKGDFYRGAFYFNLLQVPFLLPFYSWLCSSRGLLILIINLGSRSPVSTSFLSPAFKKLWNWSQFTSEPTMQGCGMLLCHDVLGQLIGISFTLKKTCLKLLPMRVLNPYTLSSFLFWAWY